MKGNKRPISSGFSVLEMMIALTLGTVVLGALLAGLHQTQIWGGNLTLLMMRDANLHLAPLLFSRWISPAGNHSVSADAIEIQDGVLELRADLSGAQGFPDGRLDDPFESLSIRLREGRLQLRSGRGGFQPVLEPIESFQAYRETPVLLRLELTATTGTNLMGAGERAPESISLFLSLSNRRPNLFAQED